MKFKFFPALALAVALLATGTPAKAQAPVIAWVSAGGSGSTCSQTVPCASFATALGVSGVTEIKCMTPGVYASAASLAGIAVSISNPLTINCPGGVVTMTGVGAIGFSITTSGVVTLRGLEIAGNGGAGSTFGISFDGGTLVLDGVHVHDCGIGLDVNGSGAATELSVTNSRFTSNGSSGGAVQIHIAPSGGTVFASLSHVAIEGGGTGLLIFGNGETQVHLADSVVSNNNAGIGIEAAGSATQFITIQRSNIVLHTNQGVNAVGNHAFVLIGESTVAWNNIGLSSNSGSFLFTYGNNQINGNGTDISSGVSPAGLH
jgi:hypothetical protein